MRLLPGSYRLRVPIALVLVALLSGVSVAVATFVLVDRYVEANAIAQTERLARTLAGSLAQPVLRSDVWQAYQMVRAPTQARVDPAAASVRIVIIDVDDRVFVSPEPVAFPIGTHLSSLPPRLAAAAAAARTGAGDSGASLGPEDGEADSWVVAEAIKADEDTVVGLVLVEQQRAISRAQARQIVGQLVALGAVAMVFIGLAGWTAGRRMTAPLERLREAMHVAGEGRVPPAVAEVGRRENEVGELARAFQSMLEELGARRQMEREMLQAERMASVGRLAAGVAHEVNNPLGGMLHAIENRRLRGGVDDATERTLSLLDRGIKQIHSTVSALLNEARHEVHDLQAEDLQDLRLLIHPQAQNLGCAVEWALQPPARLRLPAVTVRQVVLNLALNAIAAAGPGGRVRLESAQGAEGWHLRVSNTGRALTGPQLDELLQGDLRSESGRIGLGLWITGRLLHLAGGTLRLEPATPESGADSDPAAGHAPIHFATVLSATLRGEEA